MEFKAAWLCFGGSVKFRKRWISIPWLLYGYYVVIIWLLYGWWDILRYCSIPRNRWDIDGNIMGIYWDIYIYGI